MDNLFNRLSRKNMKFTENLHWGIYFRKGWVNAFAHHLHQEDSHGHMLLHTRRAAVLIIQVKYWRRW
ncbi:MAG: DUF4275 family protein [Solibacillus isronensis]|uniref:DUF4275 family protein n=1 Tax=Solibacillus isronensis TaxID=412383 RepID=UPI00335AB8C2